MRRDAAFVAELYRDGQIISRQTAFFEPTKHLKLVDPQITVEAKVENGQILIGLKSVFLARQVECSLAGADVVFSDNYFDLPAGRSVEIAAPLPEGWTLAQVQEALKLRSIYDSFALSTAK